MNRPQQHPPPMDVLLSEKKIASRNGLNYPGAAVSSCMEMRGLITPLSESSSRRSLHSTRRLLLIHPDAFKTCGRISSTAPPRGIFEYGRHHQTEHYIELITTLRVSIKSRKTFSDPYDDQILIRFRVYSVPAVVF